LTRCRWIRSTTGYRCALDAGHLPLDHDDSLEARAEARWPDAPKLGLVPPDPEPEPVDPRQLSLLGEETKP
jgi:hypothetical protein